MNFIPAASPTYWAPASVQRLTEGGMLETIPFDCQFRRFKKEELDQIVPQSAAAIQGAPSGAPISDLDTAVLARVCTAWRIQPGKDAPVTVVTFTVETARQIEGEHPGFIAQCVRAFMASITPSASAHYAEKN